MCFLKSILGTSSRFECRMQTSVFLKPDGGPLPNNIATDGNRNIFQRCRYAGQFNVTKQPTLGGFFRFWNVRRDSPFLNEHAFVVLSGIHENSKCSSFFVLVLVIKLTTIKYIQPFAWFIWNKVLKICYFTNSIKII